MSSLGSVPDLEGSQWRRRSVDSLVSAVCMPNNVWLPDSEPLQAAEGRTARSDLFSGEWDDNTALNRMVNSVTDFYNRSLEYSKVRSDLENSFAASILSSKAMRGGANPRCPALIYRSYVEGRLLTDHMVLFEDLQKFLNTLEFDHRETHVHWIHITGNNEALHRVGDKVNMHPVARRLFNDLSPQSAVNHIDRCSIAVTALAAYTLKDGELVRGHKVCMFAREDLLVTMEHELFPKDDAEAQEFTHSIPLIDRTSPLHSSLLDDDHQASMDSTSDHKQPQSQAAALVLWGGRSVATADVSVLKAYQTLVFRSVAKFNQRVKGLVSELGAGFLVYLVLSEIAHFSGSVLDLYSRCLASFQKTVDTRRVSHRRRVVMMKHLHNLQSGLTLLKTHINYSTAINIKRGMLTVMREGTGMVEGEEPVAHTATLLREGHAFHHVYSQQENQQEDTEEHPEVRNDKQRQKDCSRSGGTKQCVFRAQHMPYIRDYDESVKLIQRTIDAYEATIQEIRESLTTVADLRVTQVNTTLSLVATIFLPLTFLTGVFGMNFQYEDGVYSFGLGLLNREYGAIWFWIICCMFVVVSFGIFHLRGWTETLLPDELAWG